MRDTDAAPGALGALVIRDRWESFVQTDAQFAWAPEVPCESVRRSRLSD